MALKGRQYTVTATAVRPLAVAAGASNPNYNSDTQPGHIAIQEITFSTPAGNTGAVYIGNSDVTAAPANALAIIAKGNTLQFRFPHPQVVYADDFYVVGTLNDVVHILATPY
jgi:hypothetical protein